MVSQSILKSHFIQFSVASQQNFTNNFFTTDNHFYRCDPEKHIDDTTFYQLTYFDQAYIINTQNIKDQIQCNHDCPYFVHGSTYTCNYGDYCESSKRCDSFYDCREASNPLYICSNPNSGLRRYEFFDETCESRYCNATMHTAKKHANHVTNCEHCICYCDELLHKSHRIISLQEQLSNVEKNEVITGIKITRKKRIFFLQIQVGKLLQMNEIDKSTVRWMPIKYIRNINLTHDKFDYHILKRNARMDMDYLWFPHNQVLTGRL